VKIYHRAIRVATVQSQSERAILRVLISYVYDWQSSGKTEAIRDNDGREGPKGDGVTRVGVEVRVRVGVRARVRVSGGVSPRGGLG